MKHVFYSGLKCPPCIPVKQFIELNNLQEKVEIKYVNKDISVLEFFELGLKTTPSMITNTGQKIINSVNIINFLKSL